MRVMLVMIVSMMAILVTSVLSDRAVGMWVTILMIVKKAVTHNPIFWR
jgi:hypothetical protein